MTRNPVISVTCAVLLGGSALVFSAGVHADEIAQRKVAMQNNNNAAKTLTAMFKGETAFDGKAVAFAGYTIANDFAAARTLFPEGSVRDDSRAKPEIWQDMEGFIAALENADAAAKAVAATGEANDEAAFKEAFGGLGKACGDCHEKFRAPRNN
ncbi:MAG: cytochrome c [Hyphomicrobiales bacterium]|nr:cytochrome c [Hyphomicrobiales bacterium]